MRACLHVWGALPVVDALEGLLAGQQDVGEGQADVHGTLAVGHAVGLELEHLLWVSRDHHLHPPARGRGGRERRESKREKERRKGETREKRKRRIER